MVLEDYGTMNEVPTRFALSNMHGRDREICFPQDHQGAVKRTKTCRDYISTTGER